MKIFLLGYMGSGKSYLGKQLSDKLNWNYYDLDHEIEESEGSSISEIFEKRGEIYFRKLEKKTLDYLLAAKGPAVVSLGGGTPCYGNNMDLITQAKGVTSFYLHLGINELAERIFPEKEQRPLISHLESKDKLTEFIGKHLFERSFYYNQSDYVINCSGKPFERIFEEIQDKLE